MFRNMVSLFRKKDVCFVDLVFYLIETIVHNYDPNDWKNTENKISHQKWSTSHKSSIYIL